MAWACAVVVLAITSLSAFIRLSRAGLGCEPWPQCYAQAAQTAARPSAVSPDAPAVLAARIAHRVVAVVALLLVIALVMTTLAQGPMLWREGRMALGLLALALFLAILGRWTSDSRLPAVMLGNLLAGFAMFALSWRLVESSSRKRATAPPNGLVWWARAGAALLVAQIILGGLVSAAHAGLSCPQLLACDMTSGSWQLLNPWRETPAAVADAVNPAGALVHGLHRAGAVVVACVLLPVGVASWRSGRRAGAVVVLLLIVQAALGGMLIVGGLPLPIALAHNVTAALLLAAIVILATEASSRGPAAPTKT